MKRSVPLFLAVLAVHTTCAKTGRVSDFGFDPSDSTVFIRAAVTSDVDEIVFDRRESPWLSGPLRFSGLKDKTIRFEKGVELRAKPGEFQGDRSGESCLFSFVNCDRVRLIGYGATVRMERDIYAKPPYKRSEHRHCLNLRAVKDFSVEGLTFAESGGDGVFIGGGQRDGVFCTSENVVLRDVVCDRNFRQGLSVITAKNLLCERCIFSNTGGTPPESGVDIEPNWPHEVLQDIVFRQCRFENNRGRGLEFYLGHLNASSAPVTALLEGCTMIGNVNGFGYQQSRANFTDLPKGGEVRVVDCIFTGSRSSGLYIIDKPLGSAKLIFEQCRLVDCCTVSTNTPDVVALTRLSDTPPTDGVDFGALDIFRPRDRAWITPGRIDFTGAGVREVCGTVKIVTDGRTETVALDASWRASFAPQPTDGPTHPRVAFDSAHARVTDPEPGVLKTLEDVVLAGSPEVVFYVEAKRDVHFKVCHVKLNAKRKITLKRIQVRDYTGAKRANLNISEDLTPQDLVFRAPKAGWYALDIQAGKQGLKFLEADVPLAVELKTRPASFGLSGKGELHFAASGPFSLFAAADSYEKGAVELFAPSGASVWKINPLTDTRRYQGNGAEGLWRLQLRRPKGMHRTVRVDLTGIPAFLFLSKERYWKMSAKELSQASRSNNFLTEPTRPSNENRVYCKCSVFLIGMLPVKMVGC